MVKVALPVGPLWLAKSHGVIRMSEDYMLH
jgi:hypothetical protein